MVLSLTAIEWTRPAGLLALVLPLVLLVLSLQRARPIAIPVGTFSIWARLSREAAPVGARRRWHVPLERWFAVAALVLGALALGGPRPPPSSEPVPWRVIVDRSPSMYLAHTRADGASSGTTRLAVALAQAQSWLDAADGGAAREWIDAEGAGSPSVLARELPSDWRAPPAHEEPQPRWSRHDLDGTLWITDRAPEEEPTRAGCFASGGARVEGPISASHSKLFLWDGERVLPDPRPIDPGRVRMVGALPELLLDFVTLWTEERGLVFDGPGPVQLELRALAAGPEQALECARDGWSLRTTSRADGTPAALDGGVLETWLVGRSGDQTLPVLGWRAGTIVTSLVTCEEPEGDPALFAVSWSELLDDALAVRPGVVSLSERSDAGPGAVSLPVNAAGPHSQRDERESLPLPAILAALAAVLALTGVLVSIVRA